ncbi:MAG: D-alanyl-D-alanine carboxypeptidase [Microbacteriaceae bacterium]
MTGPFGGPETERPPASRRAARAQSADGSKPSGISGVFAKHPRIWMGTALGLAFVLLGTGAVFAGIAAASRSSTTAASTDDGAQIPQRDVPGDLPSATRLRTCTVSNFATDPRLMTLRGEVLNTTTKEVLFNRGADTPARPASAVKLLTAAAALNALGADYRLSTTVYESSVPGTIVLVGGGDATLNSRESGENVYTGAAKLSELAQTVQLAWDANHPGEPITGIVLDATLWNPTDTWNPTWSRSEQTQGYLSEVTALQVDGDRADPTRQVSPRSTTPIMRAGAAFAKALGIPDVPLSTGSNASTVQLGAVQSQPVSVLVNQMLLTSDGTLAEMLARVTSVKMGLGGGSSSVGQAITGSLSPLGVETGELTLVDGSGFSAKNAVSPAFFANFMALVLGGSNELGYVYNALSEAGKTGTLVDRFRGSSAVARAGVVAKTGKISTAHTMTGIVTAKDGTVLTFAFYAIGEGITEGAKAALDELVAGVYSCGDNLSNN